MASGGAVAEPQQATGMVEGDDGGTAENSDAKESKKSRKFKPFEAMRKLFKGGRKRTKSKDDNQVSVVSVKAKSTTALMTAGSIDDEDDDSDGGFKSHQSKQKLQGGKRSISEDSVFSPGDRVDAGLRELKTVAVSEENIHKNAFQNELFSKLKKRNSQYSDEDDGLPQSPVPPVTTADILGGSLKPHPAKSSSRESEKSLISVDSSDNEADDPFLSKWSSPGKPRSRSSDQSPPPEKGITMDFEAVKSTQALSNEAAKHKRSVKPARKTHRQSRKKRDNVAALGLPSLNEESPTKLQNDDVFTPAASDDVADSGILTVSSKPGSSEKPIVSIISPSAPKPSVAPAKQSANVQAKPSSDAPSKTASEMPAKSSVDSSSKASNVTHPGTAKIEVKKDQAPVPASKPVASTAEHDIARGRSTSVHLREKKEETSPEESSELSQALNKLKRRSQKVEADDLPKEVGKISSEKVSETDKGKVSEAKIVTVTSHDVGSSAGSVDKTKQSVQKETEEVKTSKHEEPKSVVRKAEESKPAPKNAEEIKPAPVVNLVEKSTDKQISKTLITTGGDIKQTINKQPSEESNKDDSDAKSDTSSVKSESVKKDVGFRVGSGSASTKEDYKTKRQNRSKTLPEQPQLPDEYSAKVQRAKSQRAESSPVAQAVVAGSPQRQSAYNPVPAAKKMDPKRFSLHETTPASGEPEWMAAIKKKRAAENAENKSQVPEAKKDIMSTSAKEIVIKENEKSADRMTKSFTGPSSTASSSVSDSSKSDSSKKPETFTISTSRASSVKVPAKTEAKPESGPTRYGSVKSTSKPVNIITSSSSSPAKSVSTTVSSSVQTKPYSTTSSSMSKSYTSTTTSSTKPDSIKQFGSTTKEPSKDIPKVSPTEEAKKVFSRGSSVKTVSSSSESTSSQSRAGSVKSSSVKPTSSSVAKGSVQSSDSSSEKSQKESVPAWRSGIGKSAGSVHIEIIEKDPPKQDIQMRKKPTPAPAPDSDTCRDAPGNRSSKVLDMVKNFQKLQVS